MKKLLFLLMSIFFVAVSAMAQGKSISGIVRDAADHEPLVVRLVKAL